MDINFELYKVFYHAAVCSSFSDAAQRLFITQSAVSQSVKSLEEKTGTLLFYRKGRQVQLTPEGELLFKHVEQAWNFIKTGEGKLMEIQNLEAGEIKIGIGDTICKYFLVPYLEHFYQRFPKVRIQVLNRTSVQILELLGNGSIDLGIVTLPVGKKDISVRDFIEVEDIFVASSRFAHLQNRKIPLEELVGYPLLLLEKNSATRRNLEGMLETKDILISPEIELESIDLLVEFARIGLGIAHVLKESAAAAIEKGELFVVKTEKLPRRKLGIATVNHVPLSKASEEFINKISQSQENHS